MTSLSREKLTRGELTNARKLTEDERMIDSRDEVNRDPISVNLIRALIKLLVKHKNFAKI